MSISLSINAEETAALEKWALMTQGKPLQTHEAAYLAMRHELEMSGALDVEEVEPVEEVADPEAEVKPLTTPEGEMVIADGAPDGERIETQ